MGENLGMTEETKSVWRQEYQRGKKTRLIRWSLALLVLTIVAAGGYFMVYQPMINSPMAKIARGVPASYLSLDEIWKLWDYHFSQKGKSNTDDWEMLAWGIQQQINKREGIIVRQYAERIKPSWQRAILLSKNLNPENFSSFEKKMAKKYGDHECRAVNFILLGELDFFNKHGSSSGAFILFDGRPVFPNHVKYKIASHTKKILEKTVFESIWCNSGHHHSLEYLQETLAKISSEDLDLWRSYLTIIGLTNATGVPLEIRLL